MKSLFIISMLIISITMMAQPDQTTATMKQELWLNLPVKDVAASKAFFTSLGFEATRDVPGMVGFNIGQVPVMMVIKSDFENYASHNVSDTQAGSEVLISVDAPDRKYVDEMAGKIRAAGGRLFSEPMEIQGWMYGLGFVDPDGHRWNLVHLDWENMPNQ